MLTREYFTGYIENLGLYINKHYMKSHHVYDSESPAPAAKRGRHIPVQTSAEELETETVTVPPGTIKCKKIIITNNKC